MLTLLVVRVCTSSASHRPLWVATLLLTAVVVLGLVLDMPNDVFNTMDANRDGKVNDTEWLNAMVTLPLNMMRVSSPRTCKSNALHSNCCSALMNARVSMPKVPAVDGTAAKGGQDVARSEQTAPTGSTATCTSEHASADCKHLPRTWKVLTEHGCTCKARTKDDLGVAWKLCGDPAVSGHGWCDVEANCVGAQEATPPE